jgi:hypothetical protein
LRPEGQWNFLAFRLGILGTHKRKTNPSWPNDRRFIQSHCLMFNCVSKILHTRGSKYLLHSVQIIVLVTGLTFSPVTSYNLSLANINFKGTNESVTSYARNYDWQTFSYNVAYCYCDTYISHTSSLILSSSA